MGHVAALDKLDTMVAPSLAAEESEADGSEVSPTPSKKSKKNKKRNRSVCEGSDSQSS